MIKDDYNLSELQKIEVRGFAYNIMPRYMYHYTDKDYERFSLDLLDRLVKDDGVAIDIGAHYGIYSLLAAKRARKVYAFEPVPENYEVLKRNIHDNQLSDKIVPINKAVSDTEGVVEFNVTWASDSAGFYEHPNAEVIRKIRVETNAIDIELKGTKDISFIKIDTEGHEIHVLNGLRDTLRQNKSATMLIEFNPECLANAGSSSGKLIEAILELGYDIFALHEESRNMVRVTAGMSDDAILQGLKYLNFLCLPADSWQSMLMLSHSSDMGGAERVLLETVKDFLETDNKFVIPFVVLPGDGPLAGKFNQLPIPMQIVHMRGWTGTDRLEAVPAAEVRRLNSAAVVSLAKIFADFQPQVVCTNTLSVPWAAFLAKAYGVPHLWSIHEFGDLDHGLHFDYGFEASVRYMSDLSEVIVVNSKAVQRHVARFADKSKIRLLYPQVKPPQVTSKVLSPFHPEATIKLVISGRIMPSKGQLDAVKAVQALRKKGQHAELLVVGAVGSQDYFDEIRRYCEQHEIAKYVHMVGYKNNPFNFVHLADIALVCSNSEAYGMVTIEAMYMGKVVVAANSGGTPEIITDSKDGLLYEPQDVQDLVRAIQKAVDPKIGKRIGEIARQTAGRQADDGIYAHKLLDLLMTIRRTTKPKQPSGHPVVIDLLKGISEEQSYLRKEQEVKLQTYSREIQNFSDEYNKVYAAYNDVSKQLTELQRTKAVRIQRKLSAVKHKLRRIKK